MNSILLKTGLFLGIFSVVSCDKPLSSRNTSEYRDGKSGATSKDIENPKTNDPVPYDKKAP